MIRASDVLLVAAVFALPGSVSACTLWLEGFRVYQDGVAVGVVDSAARSVACESAGLVPGSGAITMTAFRGASESAHSNSAVWEITDIPQGVRMILSMD